MKIELNKISTIADSEIKLFRNMSTILSANYDVTFIGETHMQYVSFQSSQIGHLATREISDLWIISFSEEKRRARMTFLQAKYHRAPLTPYNTFNADFFQYELLSLRPTLTSIIGKRFNFPLDILSFSCCESIGSYGVFYIDSGGQIDLAYSSANSLTTSSSLPTSYSASKVDFTIPISKRITNCICNDCKELISCFDIDSFTKAILDLEIGAELIYYPQILNFVRLVLNQQASTNAITQFLNFIDNQDLLGTRNEDLQFEGLPSSLLIINTDGKEPATNRH